MQSVKNTMDKIKWDSIIKAILVIAIGIILIVVPTESATFLYRIAGIISIVMGLISIVRRFTNGHAETGASLIGMALIMVGLYSALRPDHMTQIQNIVLGVFLSVDGMLTLENAILCAKKQVRGWLFMLIIAVLVIVFGAFVMLSSYAFSILLTGIAMVFDGLCDLIIIGVFGKKISSIYSNFAKD